jgi:hypothetical protein
VDEAKQGMPSLEARIEAIGSSPKSLYKKDFVPDAPVAASTETVDIVTGGLLEIDGVQTAAGDLVFLKDQTNPVENGFWEVQTGAWNRYAGYGAGDTECFTQKMIDVNGGAENKGLVYVLEADAYIIGQTALNFRETYLSSVKKPSTALLRDRAGKVEELEAMTPAGYGLVDESRARNLTEVLGIARWSDIKDSETLRNEAAQETIARLSARCNNGAAGRNGPADLFGLQYSDYIDGIDLPAPLNIPWDEGYKNTRLVLSGFNIYQGAGDTENVKNHLNFTFRHVPLRRRVNASDTNTGGYAATEMRTYLEGDFKTALRAALGNQLLTVRRLMSTKGSWGWEEDTVFLLSEYEIWGAPVWSEVGHGGGFQAQYPLFRENLGYKLKRYNGARDWYWTASPSSGSSAYFVYVHYGGYSSHSVASAVGGCAPAFCVA